MDALPAIRERPEPRGKTRLRVALDAMHRATEPQPTTAELDAFLVAETAALMRALECSHDGPIPAAEIERVHSLNPLVLRDRMSIALAAAEWTNWSYRRGQIGPDRRRRDVEFHRAAYRTARRQLAAARAWARTRIGKPAAVGIKG